MPRPKNSQTVLEEPEIHIEKPGVKFIFSGHESFQCRLLWLKKGYDFVKGRYSFNDEDALIRLGVGKNMVSAIRFWMKSFNVLDSKDCITEFGERMFSSNGYDPYLEDEASLWLLHYQLVKTGYASTYNIVFNQFRKEKLFFDRDVFINYLKRKKEIEPGIPFNENTLSEDFSVFLKMFQINLNTKDIEDSFAGILSELELIQRVGQGKDEQFMIETNERDRLPTQIFLFSLLDNLDFGNSISLNAIEHDMNSPGSVFCINRAGILNKITELCKRHKYISFSDNAGIKELQIKTKPNPYSILDDYYGQ